MDGHGIPVQVLSKALGVTERTIQMRINTGQYQAAEIKSMRGGKNGIQKLVAFSSLNEDEQRQVLRYETHRDIPNPVFSIDINQYLDKYGEESLRQALLREEACIEIIATRKEPFSKKRLGYIQHQWTEKLDICQDALIRLVKKYETEGFPALLRKERYDKGFRKGVCEAGAAIIKDLYCDEHKPTVKTVYNKAVKQAIELGPEFCLECGYADTCQEIDRSGVKLSSYTTAYRVIKKELTAAEIARWRYGREEFRKKFMPKTRVRKDDIRVNEQWVGDHHEFDTSKDLFVVDSNYEPARPWVTGWQDRRSNCFVGYSISFQPNSATILASLAHAMKPKPNSPFQGIPEEVLIDNGKDYRSKRLVGLKDQETAEQYRLKCQGVFSSLGIRVRFTQPYTPWAKPIERFFKEVADKFSRELPSWVGNRPSERPSNWKEEVKKLVNSGKLLTLEQFTKMFQEWLDKYHNTYQKDLGGTPLEIYQKYKPAEGPIPNDTALAVLFMYEDTRKVHPTGIKFNNLNYVNNEKLAIYVGETLRIKYDPNFLDEIHVFKDSQYICTAKQMKLLSIHSSADEIGEHIASQRKAAKIITERRKQYTLNPKRTKSKEIITGETLPSSQTKVVQVTGYENVPVSNKKTATAPQPKRSAFDKFIRDYGEGKASSG
jgi:putative transposase